LGGPEGYSVARDRVGDALARCACRHVFAMRAHRQENRKTSSTAAFNAIFALHDDAL